MTGFSKAVRNLIVARSRGACEVCFFGRVEQIHHRRPRGAGGSRRADTNQPANGLAVCSDCHRIAERDREIALANGWLVLQGHDPALVPLLRFGSDWVLMDNEGGITVYKDGA